MLLIPTVLAACNTTYYEITYTVSEGGMFPAKLHYVNIKLQVKEGGNGASVTVAPLEGYVFKEWSEGIKTLTRYEKNVQDDMTFTALFEVQTITLSFESNEHGKVVGELEQEVEYGANGTAVTAIPDEGYLFNGWTDGKVGEAREDKFLKENVSAIATYMRIKLQSK